jgi:hypothetical protein
MKSPRRITSGGVKFFNHEMRICGNMGIATKGCVFRVFRHGRRLSQPNTILSSAEADASVPTGAKRVPSSLLWTRRRVSVVRGH